MGIEFVGRVYQSVLNEGTGRYLGLPSVAWRELILHWDPDEGPWEGTAWGQVAFGDILQHEEMSEPSSAH